MNRSGVSIVLVPVLFFCTAFSNENYNYKFIKEYQTSSGAVVFDHEAHAMSRQKDCHACHSALKVFGGTVSQLLAHNYCQDGYESNDGPKECNGCHIQGKVALQ